MKSSEPISRFLHHEVWLLVGARGRLSCQHPSRAADSTGLEVGSSLFGAAGPEAVPLGVVGNFSLTNSSHQHLERKGGVGVREEEGWALRSSPASG